MPLYRSGWNIMNRLFAFLIFLLSWGFSTTLADVITVSGDVVGTWSVDTVLVAGEVRVPPGETLIIEPGVEVLFQTYCKFIVDSSAALLAAGTEVDSILFDEYYSDTSWHGIRLLNASDSCRLEYCHITHGTATGSLSSGDRFGGGVYCYCSNPIIANCLIDHCSAQDGGGIYCQSSSPPMSNLTICENAATFGGGINCYYGSRPVISNCIVINNTATHGGGIHALDHSQITIVNCTIVENFSIYDGSGAVFFWYSNSTIVNSIFWGNKDNWGEEDEQIIHTTGSTPQVTYCCIQDTLWPGEGNIKGNPLFVVGPLSDYHLSPDSPCIDTGNPDSQYNDPEDPMHPGYALWPALGTIRNDMGAYGGGGAGGWLGIIEEETTTFPGGFSLLQNYPNPFNIVTTIPFTMPTASCVSLTIYNVHGRVISTLIDGWRSAGVHKVAFDASGLSSGVYIYRMNAGEFIASGKMVLMK